MSKFTNILIDQAHNQAWAVSEELAAKMNPANPADASYSKMAAAAERNGYQVSLHESGLISADALENVDVLVIPHASSDDWEKR